MGSPAPAASSSPAELAAAPAKSRRWWRSALNYIRKPTSCSSRQLWRHDYEKISSAKSSSAFGATPALMRQWRLLLKKLQSRFNRWMRTSTSCLYAGQQERTLNIDLLYDPVSYALNFDDGCYYNGAPSHDLTHSRSLSSLS
ncbi:hypothetical protein L7F22_005563 [Adiantum nelumboides]|nr:hypothetical protein [Adiantum nelumboides]